MEEQSNKQFEGSVRVLLFSVLQDAAGGQSELDWNLSGKSRNVGQLLEEFYTRWPKLRDWDKQIRVAIDLEYVDRDHLITEGQEIAIMPPVQGG